MFVIRTEGLRKTFGDTVAVAGVTFTVSPGQVFGFLGPNGAGKTTTIKMLLGLVHPSGGEAELLGHPPGDPAVMGQVGFLPEHFSFPRWLTARELLDVHGRLLGIDSAERAARIPPLLERVGLATRGGGRIGTFSKGMMQRIGLAQAILGRPRVVFLDEPTSGLDPLGRRDVRDLIRELRADGMTVFLNSHLLSEVEAISDRLIMVRDGRVVREGTLAELTRGNVEVDLRLADLQPTTLAQLGMADRVVRASDGAVTLSLADEEALPELVAGLVAAGARVYEVTLRRPSLEDIFMSVMADPTPAEA
jgi:ABC-2 type transport system ATP-binding protein